MVAKKKAAAKKPKPPKPAEVKAPPVKCFVDGCTSPPPCTKHKWDAG
jgi:hypothetical protein